MQKNALVFLLCCVPRVICLLWAAPGDPGIYYWELSDSLLSSGVLGFEGRPSTGFEPLYPMFLAAARWLTGDNFTGVMLLQIAVASLGGVYFYRLCLLLADERTARIAVLLFAFYPYLVWQSVNVIEIAPLATLLLASSYYFCRIASVRSAGIAGAAFGVTLLLRMAVLPVPLLGVALLAFKRQGVAAAVFALAAFMAVLPFALRNHQLDGSLLPTRSGVNLYVGNSRFGEFAIPDYNTDLVSRLAEEDLRRKEPQFENGSEQGINDYYRDEAIGWMREDPWRALRLDLLKLAYFFHPRLVPYFGLDEHMRMVTTADGSLRVEGAVERGAAGNWLHSLSYSVIFLSALGGIWLRRGQAGRDAILYAMLLGFAAVCVVYFPATRLRAPVEFVLMFFAACALARGSRWSRPA